MPPQKKRKFSVSTDGSLGDDASPAPTPKIKRRKKPAIQYDPLEFCQELYDTIRNHKTEDGRLLCEAFIRVPKRRTDPEYYDVVSLPIDLLRIQHKLKSEEYEEIEQLTLDIELLVNNAKAFYKPDTQEYQDACDLWDLYSDTKNILIAEAFGDTTDKETTPSKDGGHSEREDDCSSTMTEDEADSVYEQLFATVAMAKEGERIISEMFKVLPSRVRYPEYYSVIKRPMDLKTIAQKIQGNNYTCLDEILADLSIMLANAKSFNEPGSQIYKDAGTLKKIISNKKIELESGQKRARRSARRSNQPTQRLSAICAALTYDEEDESDVGSLPDMENNGPPDVDEDSMAEPSQPFDDTSSPEWQLYNTIVYHKNSVGHLIAEPFTRLPSRRIYPDYYEEIKKPLSLLNVQKKLKNNQYRSIEILATDLELVFENAKQYNMDESKLYLDAVELQNVLRSKKKELLKEYDIADTPSGKRRMDSEERKTPKRKSLTPEDVLRKRLNILYKTVLEYQVDNRNLVEIFMVLPSKKDYPDYYHVISEPIDMNMIEAKIKADKYLNDQSLINDFELMFNNARHYNEEESQVYRDADALEKVLKRKLSQLVPLDSPKTKIKGKTPKAKGSLSPLEQKLTDLYMTIKDHVDARGRILSTPFMKLPLKAEYPDYYEVIKRPIDMQKVHQRMSIKQYDTVEDMVADFVLIFDNACKYNEPDSLIYKDALTLQRVCLEKKTELCLDDDQNEVPDMKAIVNGLMTKLYIAMYNQTDEDGRCYSDSFQDMPTAMKQELSTDGEPMEVDKPTPKRTPSFEQVKKNLDRNRYRRFDRFQEDIFEVFDYARRVSRTDSQLYEDSVELQMFFVKKRDEVLKNGEILLTPALSYTEKHLQIVHDEERKEKLPAEQREDEEKRRQQEAEAKQKQEDANYSGPNVDSDLIEHNNQAFSIGDFVYIEPREDLGRGRRRSKYREKNVDPHIICIDKMWRDEAGDAFLAGNFYNRPHETYHVATKKFLEKEVFKSDIYEDFPFTRVVGKCFVMFVKDYFKMRPDLIADKDVFVCESRYSSRQRAFKKIKIWQVPRNERLIARDTPLQPVRVASVFAEKEKVEPQEEEIDEPHILDKEREPIEIEKGEADNADGCVYFEQYKTPAGWFKLGDCVYVRSEDDKPYIAMIDKIWTDQSGSAFFHGPWFVHPIEVEHSPTRLFYKREVFRSSIEDTNPMLSIQGKCAVLVQKDYCNSRPTEIHEQDVYICESKYMEAEKSIRKLAKSMKADLEDRGLTEELFIRTDTHFDPEKGKSELRFCCNLCDYAAMRRWNVQRHLMRHPREELNHAAAQLNLSKRAGRVLMPPFADLNESTGGHLETRLRLKKPILSPKVCDDEIYFFKKPIIPQKEPSPLLQKATEEPFVEEVEENASHPESTDNATIAYREELSLDSIPDIVPKDKKKKSSKPWQPSGYLVFSAETRKQVQEEFPELTFGEISRKVGQRWRELPKEEKTRYEEKAKKLAEEHAAKQEAADKAFNTSLALYPPAGSPNNDGARMSPATTTPSRTHTPGQSATPGFQGQIQQTPVSHQGFAGYGSPQHHHMQGGPVPPPGHMYPHHPGSPHHHHHPNMLPMQAQPAAPPPRPPSPIFVAVPPRTQRLLHSEAYLRYIEGLGKDDDAVGPWERSLTATPENTPLDRNAKLPVQWLSQGAGHHDTTVRALWALRGLLMKDTLSIDRTLEFSQL